MWTPLRLGSTAAVMTSCVLLHLVNMAECVAFEKIIWLYSGALLSAAKTPPAAGSPLFTNSNVTTRGHVFYFIFYFFNALTMKNLIRCVFRSLIHQVKSNKVHVYGCVFFRGGNCFVLFLNSLHFSLVQSVLSLLPCCSMESLEWPCLTRASAWSWRRDLCLTELQQQSLSIHYGSV